MINFIDEKGKQHSALVECKRKKGVNGEKSLEGTIYTNEKILEGIGRGWRLQFQGEMYCLTFVHPIDEGDRIVVEFDAVHEFFFDFSKSIIYRELNGSNTMTAYLDFIFSGSGYDYRLEVDVNAFEKQNFGMKNRLTLFKDIISSTGLEFSVNGKVVRILQEVGTDLSTIVKKGINLNQLNIEKDAGSFITYKRGYGAYFDEDDHSKGRLTVEYLSPLAEIYGKLEGEPVIDEHYKVEDNLRTRLQKDVEESYGISAEIDMEDLTKAGYSYEQPHEGDYIMAINDDLGFRQKIRIMSYVTEFDTEENIIKHDVSCGSANLVSKVSNAENGFKDQVQADLENAVNNANSALIAANGKNKVFTGPDEPEATSIGDIWYHEIGEQTIMKYWNGYEWVPFINPDQIKDQIIEAEKGIEDAKQDANNAVNQANQAAADAGFAKDAAQNAVDQSLNAISQASSASERAQEAIQNSVNAVNQAQQALNDATELLNTVDEMQGTITSISTVVDEVNNQLAVKANQTDFDKLAGTVSSQGTAITANAQAISLKADSSTVNTIKGTVESLQSELSVQAGQIQGLVSKTDGLTTDLAQLSLKADGLDLTVSQVQNTLENQQVGGRNYIISTKLQSHTPYHTTPTTSDGGKTITTTYSTDVTGSSAYLTFAVSGWVPENRQYTLSGRMLINGVAVTKETFASGQASTYNAKMSTNKFSVDDNGRFVFTEEYKGTNLWLMHTLINGIKKGDIIVFEFLKFEIGNVATDWNMSLEDQATVTALAQLSVKADQIQATVTANKTELDGKLVAQQSQISQNATSIQSLVTKTDGTNTALAQLQIEAGKIGTTVAEVQNTVSGMEIGGRNYLRFSSDFSSVWGNNNNAIASTEIFEFISEEGIANKVLHIKASASGVGKYTYDTRNKLKSGETVTYSILARGSGLIKIGLEGRGDKQLQVDSIEYKRYSFTSTLSGDANAFVIYTYGTSEVWLHSPKLEKGTLATDWSPAPEDNVTVTRFSSLEQTVNGFQATVQNDITGLKSQQTQLAGQITSSVTDLQNQLSTQVTQLTDAINLRVEKGELLSQINLEAGQTLIQTGKLYLDAATVQFSGQAFIPSASIVNLSADKINTGTLNANNVNIINLNANSITTGTISGTNLSINLATGEVIFNKGIIKNLDDTFQMNITTGVTASRGEYLSPNNTGNTLAAGYNLMNGKIEFYAGTFGEASVSYGGLTTETHSGQYKENGIWQAGMWSGNRPAIALKMANPNTSVWQSIHRAVILSSTEYQEPSSITHFTNATWLGYGDKSGADTKQNIRGAGIGVNQSGSDVNKDEAGGLFSEAWVIARHGVYLASGYAYDSTINGRKYLAPTIRLGTAKVNTGDSEYTKQMASTTAITAGYKIAMQSKYIDLWAGNSGKINLNAQLTDINGGADSSLYGGMSFGADGTGGRVWSMAIYNRTYSGESQMCITKYGTIGRITSARKYKMNIQVANKVIDDAKKILEINPVSWIDKREFRSGNVKGRYYGFIADEFHEKGMTEVVNYGEMGQVEGLAYDRLTMYHNVILSDHEREVQLLKQEVEQLKIRVQELEAS